MSVNAKLPDYTVVLLSIRLVIVNKMVFRYQVFDVEFYFSQEMVQFTKKVARLWLSTSGLIGYTSTRIKSTSSRMSCRGVKCDCKNTTFLTQVSTLMNLNELSIKFYFFLVIWNPWLDKARETPDFGDDEYPNMVCVEAGHVSSPVLLLPGNISWSLLCLTESLHLSISFRHRFWVLPNSSSYCVSFAKKFEINWPHWPHSC